MWLEEASLSSPKRKSSCPSLVYSYPVRDQHQGANRADDELPMFLSFTNYIWGKRFLTAYELEQATDLHEDLRRIPLPLAKTQAISCTMKPLTRPPVASRLQEHCSSRVTDSKASAPSWHPCSIGCLLTIQGSSRCWHWMPATKAPEITHCRRTHDWLV